jgi:serine/threonine protein kinase
MCYAMKSNDSQRLYAGKVISKMSLQKKSAKKKLLAEIKIHRSLNHKNIVKFERFFEDRNNVYILLEMCTNQTLMEMLKRRKRMTEAETQCLMWQLLCAVKYLHSNNVIHRDLKLGNLFLYEDMEIKVGDFGLAARLEHSNERKTTLCGTPNYIAPEILQNSKRGHSFQVDIWSMGVIMYTLLIGRPPFETNSVKKTYQKIQGNIYSFPQHTRVSSAAKELISKLLHPHPDHRPTLQDIESHPFFTALPFPRTLPKQSLMVPFQFNPCVHDCFDFTDRIGVSRTAAASDNKHHRAGSADSANGLVRSRSDTGTVSETPAFFEDVKDDVMTAEEENEYGPEILRRPRLLRSNTMVRGTNVRAGNKPRLHRSNSTGAFQGTDSRARSSAYDAPTMHRDTEMTSRNSTRPASANPLTTKTEDVKMGNVHPSTATAAAAATATVTAKSYDEDQAMVRRMCDEIERSFHGLRTGGSENVQPNLRSGDRMAQQSAKDNARNPSGRSNTAVDEAMRSGASSSSSSSAVPSKTNGFTHVPSDFPHTWVTRWVDYSNKYGIGYLMADGSIGVHFNDSSKIIRSADENTFEYIERKSSGAPSSPVREKHVVQHYPEPLKKKVTLLRHFASYLTDHHKRDGLPLCAFDDSRPVAKSNMVYVRKWLKTKHAVLFRLSNRTIQVVFNDHTELILSSEQRLVTYTNKQKIRHTYPLDHAFDEPRPGLAKRMQYTKDILFRLLRR